MSNTRNYDDDSLKNLVGYLDEGEKKMLRLGGALPAEPFRDMEPSLRGEDIARMIELMEDN
jgi:hypothetical protein